MSCLQPIFSQAVYMLGVPFDLNLTFAMRPDGSSCATGGIPPLFSKASKHNSSSHVYCRTFSAAEEVDGQALAVERPRQGEGKCYS